MSKTTHYELNTPIGSEVLSVMTGLNPNFTAIDGVMYDNETRSTQALNKANVNEQNIATALGRITTAEGDIDTLESGLETANTNISGLTSRVSTAETNIVSANNRIQENTNAISNISTSSDETISTNINHTMINNVNVVSFGNDSFTISTNGIALNRTAKGKAEATCEYFNGSANVTGMLTIAKNSNVLYLTDINGTIVTGSYIQGQLVFIS